jgi:primosomal protein N''
LVAAITRTLTGTVLRATDPCDLARLEHAQQAHLQVERHLGDLVEEQRAAVRRARNSRRAGASRR